MTIHQTRIIIESMVTGFPSPAQGYEQNRIDFNQFLYKHPSATVVMQIDSSRYNHMCIFNGDYIIIDRSKKVKPNSLVVYESEGQFVIGRVFDIKGETFITGVITHVLHTVKES